MAAREVWVSVKGKPATAIKIEEGDRVVELKQNVKAKFPNKMGHVDVDDIDIYPSKDAFDKRFVGSDERKAPFVPQCSYRFAVVCKSAHCRTPLEHPQYSAVEFFSRFFVCVSVAPIVPISFAVGMYRLPEVVACVRFVPMGLGEAMSGLHLASFVFSPLQSCNPRGSNSDTRRVSFANFGVLGWHPCSPFAAWCSGCFDLHMNLHCTVR
jgi:hypothetical protein